MAEQKTPTHDPQEFRQALGKFATGVAVIATCEADGTPRGFTANSFTSVSLDPPLVLVCIARTAASCEVFVNARNFSVSVLSEAQKDISGLFATQRADKFEVTSWRRTSDGVPVIEQCLAWFECAHHSQVDAGDHMVLIGQVTDFDCHEGLPLGYFAGNYFSLEMEAPLVDAITASNANTVIGAVYESNGSVLLRENPADGSLTVPEVGRDGERARLDDLKRRYDTEPLMGEIEFIYAVFEDERTNSVTIYYRGRAGGPPPDGHQFFAFDAIPWDRIVDPPVKTMLMRYVREAQANRFAVYMGTELEGVVKPLR